MSPKSLHTQTRTWLLLLHHRDSCEADASHEDDTVKPIIPRPRNALNLNPFHSLSCFAVPLPLRASDTKGRALVGDWVSPVAPYVNGPPRNPSLLFHFRPKRSEAILSVRGASESSIRAVAHEIEELMYTLH